MRSTRNATPSRLLLLLAATSFILASVSTTADAQYTCDPTVCKLPNCRCASSTPPVANPPQFFQLTFDDSLQASTYPNAGAKLFAGRKNPNGCPARGTFYVSTDYTDYYMATQWYAAGNEIAAHTMSHVKPTYQEVEGCRAALNKFGGIPRGKINGFRHPFLEYSGDSIRLLGKMGFQYDSSIPMNSDEKVWPYTLDNGVGHGCLGSINLCTDTNLSIPGFWEIPMNSITNPATGISYSMDVTMENPISEVVQWMKTAFDSHYNGNRAPFGLYLHPTWFSGTTPLGPNNPSASEQISALNEFLNYVQSKPDVHMVTSQQIISYMKNPVDKAQLGNQTYMQCPTPPAGICNGVGGVETAKTCNFNSGTIHTCYGCPKDTPNVGNIKEMIASLDPALAVPDNCDTKFWNPATKTCLCNAPECEWKDTSRQINFDPKSLEPLSANGTFVGNPVTSPDVVNGNKASSGSRTVFSAFTGIFVAVVASALY